MDKIETRAFGGDPLEFRASSDKAGIIGTFAGYAMRYDQPSEPLPFIETFTSGSFTRSLKSRNDVRLNVNHDSNMLLASRRAKTLRIEDRADGLWIEADLPDTSYARDLRVLIERGDVYSQSVEFSAVKDQWSPDYGQRTVTEAKLFGAGVVTGFPAYPSTTASVRNLTLIARRTQTDADALADAIAALEAGELDADQMALLHTVVDRAAGVVMPPVIEEAPATTPLSVLLAQLDLKAKDF